jgi:hypothetical protein
MVANMELDRGSRHRSDAVVEWFSVRTPRNLPRRRAEMANKKHRVQFDAHRTVREEVPVKFKTRAGEKVSFDAKKKVKEPVRVKFMAED